MPIRLRGFGRFFPAACFPFAATSPSPKILHCKRLALRALRWLTAKTTSTNSLKIKKPLQNVAAF